MAYYPLLQRVVQLVGVVLSVSATLVRASYYMDDTDSRIAYSSGSSGGYWDTTLDSSFDETKLYGGSYHRAVCHTPDNCTMTIPFNGPGIALYAVVVYGITFTVAVDGGTPTNHHFDGVWNCCNGGILPAYNFEIYNVSSLSYGNHVLLLTLLDNTVGYMTNINASIPYFDYAIINNDTNVNPVTSSISPSPSTNPPSRPASRSIIGPAAGGAIGGVVAISAIVFALFCIRRRTRRGDKVAINPDTHAPMSNVEHANIVGANQLPSSNDTPSNLAAIALPTPVIGQPLQYPPQPTASPDPYIPHSSPTIPATPSLPTPQTVTVTSPLIDSIPSPSPRDPTDTTDSVLASEEARFLHGLYSRNVPPDQIANLIQVMRERRETASGVAGPSGNAENAAPGSAPPAYDFTA